MLDRTGKQLLQWPIIELEKLRIKEVKLSTVLNGGSLYEVLGVTAAQVPILSSSLLFRFGVMGFCHISVYNLGDI